MNLAYIFHIGVLNFIINIQQSTIGYTYPRIFVRFPDDSYLNYDLYLGTIFPMSEEDWLSWIDGTEVRLDDIREVQEVAAAAGIDWDAFQEYIFKHFNKIAE